MYKELTKRQTSILEFLEAYLSERGYPPSLREIAKRFSIKSPKNARKHLEALEKKGFIRRSPNISRAIELFTSAPSAPAAPVPNNALTIPIAGRVKAGPPHLAVEDIAGHATLDRDLFRLPRGAGGAFLLKIEGESMTGAGIENGDYVLVRPQKEASTGDIVVAMLDNEATVKRFIKKGRTVVLKPENPGMEPITISGPEREGGEGGEFTIVGKVISVIKRLEG